MVVQKIAAAAGAKLHDADEPDAAAAVAGSSGVDADRAALGLCVAAVAGCHPLSALSSDVMAL